ncbi:MAG: peptidase domain-containing ABC transporter [Prevotellaceae bacterium]|jgi:ATP-binding cassette subfamily B protein|nr:peptidase domain-containing ABC transporter [Prevotellaceae bacterium]
MKKSIRVKQRDASDCGAACLASVAAYYDLHLSVAKIRQMASTDKRGTNINGMVEAAESLGFAAKGVKALDKNYKPKTDSLYKIPKPAIAHIITDKNLMHFVVIYKIAKDKIHIMNPGTGEIEKQNIQDFCKKWTGYLILLVPDEDFVKRNEKTSVTQRFWFLFKPHKAIFVQALFGSVVYTVLGLASSVCVQKIIDYVIPEGNKNLLNLICVLMIAATLLSLFINYVRSLLMMRAGIQINTRLVLGYYKHLLKLPQSFFDTMRSGEIISRMGDAARINSFISGTMLNLVINIFTVIVAFALMFSYYWKLAVIMLVVIPVYYLIYFLYNKANRVIRRKLMEQGAELQAQLVESINSAGTIKRFGIESHANMKTEDRYVTLTRTGWRSGIYDLISSSASNLFSGLFTTTLYWAGTIFVLDNVITPGELMSFNTLTGYFMSPVIALVGVSKVFQEAKIAADRLFEIFDLKEENDTQKTRITKEQCGDIVFNNVSFRYGSRANVFTDFNIRFEKGKINAIVGESGSGKTTLVALLQNLYPLQQGNITIGEIDIKHVYNADLRSLVGVVPQNIELFEGSIFDNIILDDYEPEWNRVFDICRDVGIIEFIENLPDGMKTNTGENGIQLSGGQRQRLAIARALYRNPEILILDEATSSLDSASEKNIKDIVNKLKEKGKTIILIAHRLGTVMTADKIFVLENGILIEEGTHSELIAKGNIYSKFWESQTNIQN